MNDKIFIVATSNEYYNFSCSSLSHRRNLEEALAVASIMNEYSNCQYGVYVVSAVNMR